MRIFSLVLLLFPAVALLAQPKQNSIYSRYGIGDLLPQYFAANAGYGAQTTAFHDPFHLNLNNPASLSFLRTTALETGLYAKYSHYKTATNNALDNWSGNLAYIALGFTLKSPINEVLDKIKSPWRSGMAISLTPYSLIGYDVQTRDSIDNIGLVTSQFKGSGGTYKLGWSGALSYKRTSLGANLGWVFGKATYDVVTDFDALATYSYLSNQRLSLGTNGFVWKVGLQHDLVLETFENDRNAALKYITIGVTGEGNHSLRINKDDLFVRSRRTTADGQFLGADTLRNFADVKQTLTLPASFSVGFQYVHANKFRIGAQGGMDFWSAYDNEARPESFRNAFNVSAGTEWTPDYGSYNNYLKRIRYRLGAYYRQDPRSINTQNLNDYGLTFGFGLPLILPRQQTSFVNLAFELGQLGANTALEETYFRITAGFTLNDNTWFYKRRFE